MTLEQSLNMARAAVPASGQEPMLTTRTALLCGSVCFWARWLHLALFWTKRPTKVSPGITQQAAGRQARADCVSIYITSDASEGKTQLLLEATRIPESMCLLEQWNESFASARQAPKKAPRDAAIPLPPSTKSKCTSLSSSKSYSMLVF